MLGLTLGISPEAIQQNEDGDWTDVGSIDEFSYFGPTADPNDEETEMEATTTFQMYDAAGFPENPRGIMQNRI